ncbi:MAG: S41 family peptidase [Ruminococcus sp.]|nr:S41 family peptidase [Ruminococcus sp.]
MKKQISLQKGILMCIVTGLAACMITTAIAVVVIHRHNTELQKKFARLDALDAEIRSSYYTKEIDEEALMDATLKGYVAGLGDPYSVYLTDEELAETREGNTGQYVGIGVSVLQSQDNTVLVTDVFPNSPAEKGGIGVGDYIIRVNDLSVSEDAQTATDAIKGLPDTEVTVTVLRPDGSEHTTTMLRAKVDEPTVFHEMLEDSIGYIRIKKFRTITIEQFLNAYEDLQKQGAKGFVFDVRNNGGGLLSALEAMVDPFLAKGDFAFAYDQNGKATPIIESDAECAKVPMVILTNGSTASAAELFACLLRDYADAVLVGEKTFGKGIMQTTYSLPDGGGLTLTTATYSTGETECYHGVGISPDVESVYDPAAETDTQLEDAKSTLSKLLDQ